MMLDEITLVEGADDARHTHWSSTGYGVLLTKRFAFDRKRKSTTFVCRRLLLHLTSQIGSQPTVDGEAR